MTPLAPDDEDDRPLIVVCRDIPGVHTGGLNCWCRPTSFFADESDDAIAEAVQSANRPH